MIVVIMGVSGSGKTTIGRLLADDLGWTFVDADDLHPPQNIAAMSAGVPLTDSDREPWLGAIREELVRLQEQGTDVVLACSALRASFRERLAEGLPVRFVHLSTTEETLRLRMQDRSHFMPAELLQSQLATLESPQQALEIDAAATPDAIVRAIREALSPLG